jgi:hypothetical protein
MSRTEKHAAASRREFVVAAGLSGVAAATAAPAWAGPLVEGSKRPLPALGLLAGADMAEWQQRVGDSFVLAESGAKLALVGIEPLPARGRRPSRLRRPQGFAALFEAADAHAPEGDAIYALRSPRQGELALHLGPRIAAGDKFHYVAVFN